jgi:hypothetical protein
MFTFPFPKDTWLSGTPQLSHGRGEGQGEARLVTRRETRNVTEQLEQRVRRRVGSARESGDAD